MARLPAEGKTVRIFSLSLIFAIISKLFETAASSGDDLRPNSLAAIAALAPGPIAVWPV